MEEHSRALLVLVDSRQEDAYADVESAALAALAHWGMPYRSHDLAQGQPSAEMLRGCAALLLAQQNVAAALSDEAAQAIAEAVADGLGYVSCDGGVGYAPSSLRHMLGVRAVDLRPALGVQVIDAGHFVASWQAQGERHRFKRPLEMSCVTPTMSRVRVLLEGDRHPAMWITHYGLGRVVQWALHPGVWQREVFGHCEGLDDLMWRGIVWAARKPFAMLAMPPFSTATVGDAIGAHDFAWIEALREHGFPPHVGVFPDDIDALSEIRVQSCFFDKAVHHMSRYAASGMAEFSPHAATWDRSYLLYSRVDGSEIPPSELAQRLSAVDRQFARYGIPWARTVNPHRGQLGRNALPFLRARGVEFSLSGQLPGETWEGERRLWDSAPFGHPGFTIAPLPESGQFYIVASGRSHHETTVSTGPNTYRLRDYAYLAGTDLMWGRTRWQDHCQVDDWDAMAEAAVQQVRLGFNALFFACPATHEQTIAFVRLAEWESLWAEVDRRTARYGRWPALYSDVAAYARAKHGTRVVDASLRDSSLVCTLEGAPELPLWLYVWEGFGDSDLVVHRYERVEPFEGSKQVVVSRTGGG